VPDLHIQRHDMQSVVAMLDTLADIYAEEYAEPPYDSSPGTYGREAFIERTERQVKEDGFSFLGGYLEDELIGYAFGYTHGSGRWWRGESDPPPPAELIASPAFVVMELIVRRPFRRHGYAHRMMDAVLSGRRESFATLCVHPQAQARAIYVGWGWERVCELSHGDGVAFEVMVKGLG
jgi:GNAT superfamily N-acetyltransferase